MKNFLLDEYPLIVLPNFAKEVGLNQAIILQQLHYWLQKSNHYINGRYWIYNTYEDWQKQFIFWSTPTIKRIFSNLETRGYVISDNFNAKKSDHTKWYTINYEMLELKVADHIDPPIVSTCTAHSINLIQSSIRSETTSETININKSTPPGELTPLLSKIMSHKKIISEINPSQTPVSQESTPFQATQKGFIYPELKIKYSEWNLVAEKFIYEFKNPDNVNFLNQTDRVITLSLLEIMKDDKKTEDLAADIEMVFEYAKDEKVSKTLIKKLINIAFIIDKFTPEQYQKAFDIAKKRGKEQSLSYLRKVLEKAFMPELYTDVYAKKKAF